MHVRIGIELAVDGLLEMLNRLAQVLGHRRRGLRVARVAPPAFDERRVHDAEDAMRFAIGRLGLDRLLSRGDGFLEPALPHVESRELGDDVAALRIELGRAFEGGNRAGNVVGAFEMASEHELRVRVAGFFRRIGRGLRRCRLRGAATAILKTSPGRFPSIRRSTATTRSPV